MTETLAPESAIEPANDPVYATDFVKEMLRQTRALDSYGQWDGKPVPTILAGYVLSKEQKRALPTIGDPDELTLARVKAFHNAIAVLIEKECGQMAVPFVQITHEGFGRALITVGKLVVMDRTLRDVHRFGFDSLSKMKTEADKHLAVALALQRLREQAQGVARFAQRQGGGQQQHVAPWLQDLVPLAAALLLRSASLAIRPSMPLAPISCAKLLV